jgi:hypothetical protein
MDALLDPVPGPPRDAEQLDPVAELVGEGDVVRGDRRMPSTWTPAKSTSQP